MSLISEILNTPTCIYQLFVDNDRPFDLFLNGEEVPDLPSKALILSSDKHIIRKTDQFFYSSDQVYDDLKGILPVNYLKGNQECYDHAQESIEDLCQGDGTKLFFYFGHGHRYHPWVGEKAWITFFDSKEFKEISQKDNNPWIVFLDSCYSGLFAKNALKENSIYISTNTDRSWKHCTDFVPMLVDIWSQGYDLQTAFEYSANYSFENSSKYYYNYIKNEFYKNLKIKIDKKINISKSAKQLYSDNLNPRYTFLF